MSREIKEAKFCIPKDDIPIYEETARLSSMPIGFSRDGAKTYAHLGPAQIETFDSFWGTKREVELDMFHGRHGLPRIRRLRGS